MAKCCAACSLNWPSFLEYRTCPKCGRRTEEQAASKPMSLAAAASLKRELDFAKYYEEHDARRQGPSPEHRGREEARTIIELDRQLEGMVSCGKCGEPTAPIVCEFREPVCDECWEEIR